MMRLRCLSVHRNMNVIVPPHPTPRVTDHERAVPVSVREQERWWGCGACVCTGTWALLSHPTPPHTTPPHLTANNDESAVTISRMRDDEGAQVSDILLTGVRKWVKFRVRKWGSGPDVKLCCSTKVQASIITNHWIQLNLGRCETGLSLVLPEMCCGRAALKATSTQFSKTQEARSAITATWNNTLPEVKLRWSLVSSCQSVFGFDVVWLEVPRC